MKKVKTKIKMPFGEIIVEGNDPTEVLEIIASFPENFSEKVKDLISSRLIPSISKLKGIIELTTEGPVIITRAKLTHYEAIGLVMYMLDEKKGTAAQLTNLLKSSGIKCVVPARLNEMTKRGQVFKPDPNKPEFKLTVPGERWVEDEILPRIG